MDWWKYGLISPSQMPHPQEPWLQNVLADEKLLTVIINILITGSVPVPSVWTADPRAMTLRSDPDPGPDFTPLTLTWTQTHLILFSQFSVFKDSVSLCMAACLICVCLEGLALGLSLLETPRCQIWSQSLHSGDERQSLRHCRWKDSLDEKHEIEKKLFCH